MIGINETTGPGEPLNLAPNRVSFDSDRSTDPSRTTTGILTISDSATVSIRYLIAGLSELSCTDEFSTSSRVSRTPGEDPCRSAFKFVTDLIDVENTTFLGLNLDVRPRSMIDGYFVFDNGTSIEGWKDGIADCKTGSVCSRDSSLGKRSVLTAMPTSILTG
jgi:hypothetical protein